MGRLAVCTLSAGHPYLTVAQRVPGCFVIPTPGHRSNVTSLAAADGTAAAVRGGPLKCLNPTGGLWGRQTNPANPLTVVKLATGDESRQMRGWRGWEGGSSAASKSRELVGRHACSCGGEAALLARLLSPDPADQLFRRAVSCIGHVSFFLSCFSCRAWCVGDQKRPFDACLLMCGFLGDDV